MSIRPAMVILLAAFPFAAVGAPATVTQQLIFNGGFEDGARGWAVNGDFQADARFANANSGSGYAYLATPAGDPGASLAGTLEQSVAIPDGTVRAVLSFRYGATSFGRRGVDSLEVTVRDAAGRLLETVAWLPKPPSLMPYEYVYFAHELGDYQGRSVTIRFTAATDTAGRATLRLDDVRLICEVESSPPPGRLAEDPDSVRTSPEALPEEAGLAAEMAREWQRALDIYRSLLDSEPGRADLWRRVADIEARRGDREAAAEALGHAVAAAPSDAGLHSRHSQALAAAGRAEKALAAIGQAQRLDPDNVEFLRARATLATWAGDTSAALASFEAILELVAGDREAELGRARATAWLGETDRAIERYAHYLERYPDDREARLEYARTQGWRGDFAAGLEALEEYPRGSDPSVEYDTDRARLLVGADRPNAALSLLSPWISETTDDSWLRGTFTLALAASGRPRRALDQVAVLEELHPDDLQTVVVRRAVTAPLRSTVRPIAEIYSDSDSVDHFRLGIEGSLRLSPSSRLTAGFDQRESRADRGSGLEPLDGGETIGGEAVWLELRQRLGPRAMAWLRAGSVGVDGRDEETTYRVGLRFEPADGIDLDLYHERDLFAVSPRTLSLGILRDGSGGALDWSPAPRYRVRATASRENLSDGNGLRQLSVEPRRQILRRSRFNLDLGLRGWWLSFDRDPGNGYYAPSDFRRYSLTSSLYWKIDDQRGLSLSLAPGFFRDETMDSYEFAADVAIELTLGIYGEWMLVVRGSATENARARTGAFNATSASLLLTRRF